MLDQENTEIVEKEEVMLDESEEDTTQIDELSSSKLMSYVNKASDDIEARKPKMANKDDLWKLHKRDVGVNRALKKVASKPGAPLIMKHMYGEEADAEVVEESAASETLKPNPSKAEMLATFTSLMSQLGKEDLSKLMNDALAQIGKEAEKTPSATAPGKTGMGQMPKISVKEDVAEMFAGEELSEEFMDKASTLFEAAVSARVTLEKVRIEEEHEAMLTEAVEAIQEETTSKVDQYLDYVVDQWMEENKIAIEKSLRTEIAEDFISKLHDLFTESYISVPEEEVDVLGELGAQIAELEQKLDESLNQNIELRSVINEAEKETAFDEISEGLVATQVEKFRTLAEGIDFTDVESYRKKLGVIKEQYFSNKTKTTSNIVAEETDEPLEDAKPVALGEMANYVSAISRTKKL